MADNKTSFLLYADIIHTVRKLPDEKAGHLFKHILSYVNDENPETDDIIISIAFEPIKQALKRDLKKYEAICLRNKGNGKKGGRPKSKPEEPKKPTGLFGNPEEPKKADSDIDSESDNGNNKYTYSQFYDSEIAKSNDDLYLMFVKFLYGENDIERKLTKILSMKDQLTAAQFEKLRKKSVETGGKIKDVCLKIENNKVKYSSVYLTINNFLNKGY